MNIKRLLDLIYFSLAILLALVVYDCDAASLYNSDRSIRSQQHDNNDAYLLVSTSSKIYCMKMPDLSRINSVHHSTSSISSFRHTDDLSKRYDIIYEEKNNVNNWITDAFYVKSENLIYVNVYNSTSASSDIFTLKYDKESNQWEKRVLYHEQSYCLGITYNEQRKELYWTNGKSIVAGSSQQQSQKQQRVLFNLESAKKLLYLKYDDQTETIYVSTLNYVYQCSLWQVNRDDCKIIARDLQSARGLYLDSPNRLLYVVDHKKKNLKRIKLKSVDQMMQEQQMEQSSQSNFLTTSYQQQSNDESYTVSTILSQDVMPDIGDIFYMCLFRNKHNINMMFWTEFSGKIKLSSLNNTSEYKTLFSTNEYTYSINIMDNSSYPTENYEPKEVSTSIMTTTKLSTISIQNSKTTPSLETTSSSPLPTTTQVASTTTSLLSTTTMISTTTIDLKTSSEDHVASMEEVKERDDTTTVATSLDMTTSRTEEPQRDDFVETYFKTSTKFLTTTVMSTTVAPSTTTISQWTRTRHVPSTLPSQSERLRTQPLVQVNRIRQSSSTVIRSSTYPIKTRPSTTSTPSTTTYATNSDDEDTEEENSFRFRSNEVSEVNYNIVNQHVTTSTVKPSPPVFKFTQRKHQKTEAVDASDASGSDDIPIANHNKQTQNFRSIVNGSSSNVKNLIEAPTSQPQSPSSYNLLRSSPQLNVALYIVICLLCFSLVINIILLYVSKMKQRLHQQSNNNSLMGIGHEISGGDGKTATMPSQRSGSTTKTSANSGGDIECNINLLANSNGSATSGIDSDH